MAQTLLDGPTTVPESDFHLQAIAVDPELRGACIGSILLDDVMERGAGNGSARLTLDVAARNNGAGRLYARRGFTESSEWPSLRFVPTIFNLRAHDAKSVVE